MVASIATLIIAASGNDTLVVADYNRIEEFIPAVEESEVVERRGEEIIIEQTGRAGIRPRIRDVGCWPARQPVHGLGRQGSGRVARPAVRQS